MNKNLKELIELSIIDKEIDSFNPQLEAIEKKLKKSQEKIDIAQGEIDTIKSSIDENVAKIKIYEEQIVTLSEQLKNITKKSKDVSTEKEMKALSLEEDIAKEKISFANEEIERLGAINEKKVSSLDDLTKDLEALEESQKESVDSSKVLKSEIEEKKSGLFASREAKINNFDQKILSFYEKIRNWAGNSAVVPVQKQACYGCYMKISDKSYSDVIKSEEIVTCPHCGRIIYVESKSSES